MTNDRIDNSFDVQKAILWQYDRAVNLVNLLRVFDAKFGGCVSEFWDAFADEALNLSSETWKNEIEKLVIRGYSIPSGQTVFSRYKWQVYGLSLWGIALDVPWPQDYMPKATDSAVDNDKKAMHMVIYRNLVRAKMYLVHHGASGADIAEYLRRAFPDDKICAMNETGDGVAQGVKSLVKNTYDTDMTIGYSCPNQNTEDAGYVAAVAALIETFSEGGWQAKASDPYLPHPAGVLVGDVTMAAPNVIGLNETQSSSEQKLSNFSPVPAKMSETGVNGGRFSQ